MRKEIIKTYGIESLIIRDKKEFKDFIYTLIFQNNIISIIKKRLHGKKETLHGTINLSCWSPQLFWNLYYKTDSNCRLSTYMLYSDVMDFILTQIAIYNEGAELRKIQNSRKKYNKALKKYNALLEDLSISQLTEQEKTLIYS